MSTKIEALSATKEDLFRSLANLLSDSEDWVGTYEVIRADLRRSYSREFEQILDQVDINRAIDKILMWYQPSHADEMKLFRKEFRSFVRRLRIKLGDFDRILKQSKRTAPHLQYYLMTYYLIVRGKAPAYLIDCCYEMLLNLAYGNFMERLHDMVDTRSDFVENTEFMPMDLIKPDSNELCTGLVWFFINRADSLLRKTAAILFVPYLAWKREDAIRYLFLFKGDEIEPLLCQLFDGFIDLMLCEAEQ
jgi:hypothetical protein